MPDLAEARGPMKNTLRAIKKFLPLKNAWKPIETMPVYEKWKEAIAAAELQVRLAFFEDTKDRNSLENCLKTAGLDYIIMTALLSDGYDLVPAGDFSSFLDWVNHAASYIGFVKESAPARLRKRYKPLCFDAGDRLCTRGEHFRNASEGGRFPVKYYFKKVD